MAKGATTTPYTSLGSYEASSAIRSTLEKSTRGVRFNHISVDESDSRRLGNPIAEFAVGKDGSLIKKQWGVQIEIYDEGDQRRVLLGAERSSHKEMALAAWSQRNAFDRADALGEVSFDEKLGKEKIRLIIENLKKSDPRLEIA